MRGIAIALVCFFTPIGLLNVVRGIAIPRLDDLQLGIIELAVALFYVYVAKEESKSR